ncbi:ABC transporter substrate-binding protein [Neoroseomonas soli]|uniref:ABC transporter substrate-binding protein n=1 Tax=Neoroseomonas soli TaxID=1081025 RepID=A0A9X9WWM3_9PROT|nr:ABC transporter substrate-binding protein [Neoroseomonas soli]MBR0671552.1 hypothetical protein [Neoroseomonas soli]
MERRHLLAAAAVLCSATPAARARAQGSAVPRVCFLVNGGPGPLSDTIRRDFVQDLAALGSVEGRDIRVEFSFAQGVLDRLPGLAAGLVQDRCDILVGLGGPASRAAQRATDRIPVIFSIVTDPVALGLVASVERPGRNVTGVTSLDPRQANRQMELLKRALPGVERVGILSDHTIPGADASGMAPIDRANIAAAEAVGLRPQLIKLARPTTEGAVPDADGALGAMQAQGAQVVLVLELPLAFAHRRLIAEAAAARRIPTLFPGGMRDAGGLITYGTTVTDTWRRIPAIVDRILKGASPGDLPVEFITRRELVINLATAARIGVTVPPDLLAEADQVIR